MWLHPEANKFLEDAEDEIRERIRKKLRGLASRPERGERLKYSDFWLLSIAIIVPSMK